MERLRNQKMDTWLRIWVLEEKGWVGGKNKGNLATDETNSVEKKWYLILWMLKWSEPLGEKTRRLKRINITTSMIMKDWYLHRSMRTPFRKGMESTLDIEATRIPQLKTKQRIGLQNKPEQTYDRYFVRSFRGGAYTGSIAQHHHVQGSAHDIRSIPESA